MALCLLTGSLLRPSFAICLNGHYLGVKLGKVPLRFGGICGL